jgi:hypothetical protein
MFLDRALLKFLLARRNSKHLRSGRPRLVGFAFDQITLKIHLDGRFEDAELTALEQLVFPKLPKSGVCMDIGANIGNHSVVFAGHFSKVHAFEPNPNVFKALSINASLRDNITVWNLGCSDKAAELDVVENPMNLGSTGIGIGAVASRAKLSVFRCCRWMSMSFWQPMTSWPLSKSTLRAMRQR